MFAKSDVQPLLNQGALKNDVARSILHAVAGQTIAGLAQGRKIKGRVLYLGGPLTFMPELRACFDEQLGLTGINPENSLFFVALGAAYYAPTKLSLRKTIDALTRSSKTTDFCSGEPLFTSYAEYDTFCSRHQSHAVPRGELLPDAKVWVGIDAGSTTVKAAVIDEQGRLLFSRYLPSGGSPVSVLHDFLCELRAAIPQGVVVASAATGYGEDLSRAAFGADFGLVETAAHVTAARAFLPDVDFVIDIGGQDMKCFKVEGGDRMGGW